MNPPQQNFYGLGIAPGLLSAIERLGITVPTPIQHRAIPIGIEGKDLIGIAQTGTGKTLAFGIPMLQRLAAVKGGQGLVLLPTRELAMQVDEALHQLGRGIGLRTALVIGGAGMGGQVQKLRAKPHIIVATPGRLLDHIETQRLNLSPVKVLVLDEADRMLDMGFAPQIKRILAVVPHSRQTMLFSATMPAAIVDIAKRHMQLPLRVEVAPSGTAPERVEHELFIVSKDAKPTLLKRILTEYRGTVLVFSRTKHGTKKLAREVSRWGHSVAELHSNRSLGQRRQALEGFKSGRYRVLVATDIAARGIDVKGIELVVNYDLPASADDYIHRIGRTGRAGLAGKAISFATPDQGSDVRAIERLLKSRIPVRQLPDLPRAEFSGAPAPTDQHRYQPRSLYQRQHGGAPFQGHRQRRRRPSSGFHPTHGRR